MGATHLEDGGVDAIRTRDPHNAIVVLFQLSYDPNQACINLKEDPALCQNFFTPFYLILIPSFAMEYELTTLDEAPAL